MTDKQPRNDDNEYPSGEHRGDVRAAGPDLKSLRLPSNYGATLGVEKLLTNVTICRPKKTQFFRTHISDEMTYPVMLLENKEAHEYYVVELELPARVDRKVGAELVTRYFFPVSHRSIEAWPLAWRHVNGKALAETAELFAFAQSKLDAASPIRGGRRQPQRHVMNLT